MRKLLAAIVFVAFAVGMAGSASAALIEVRSSIGSKLGFGGVTVTTATGVVTVNGSFGGSHLITLRVAPTDPADGDFAASTDPEVLITTAGVDTRQVFGGGGNFFDISGNVTSGGLGTAPLTGNVLAIGGVSRICLLFSGCNLVLPLILSENGTRGIGIGGIVTVAGTTMGGGQGLRVTLENAPWQIHTATLLNNVGPNNTQLPQGATITRMHHGFVHAVLSGTSSTAKPSGILTLVTPTQVHTKGIAPQTDKLALFNTITFHFVPEPGLLLLLGSGAAGLVLFGRSRMRK